MRLPNGYGTVYKLSGNRRRPWVAAVTIGWETVINKKTGKEKLKQIQKPIGYFEKKEDGLDALLHYRLNPVPLKADIALKELYNEWSVNAFETIEDTTIGNYRAAWNYLKRYYNTPFKELRTSHYQTIINNAHKKDNKSNSTLKKIKVLIGLLYSYAMENDIADKNYAEFIKLPKTVKKEKETFTELEIKIMWDYVNQIKWLDTILIMIYTGMRISEMLMLTEFNVKDGFIQGGLKTDAGKDRIIPIHPKIKPLIDKRLEQNGQALICRKDGSKFNASKNYRENYYYRVLENKLLVDRIRKLKPHSCRHTFATMMDKAGADTLSIQRIIGHADYDTTANTYTHPDMEKLKKAMNMI